MIFKKLELQGFKSFSDRTEVNFQDGLNAVVGPNGCGKSNIADAIRWVLGEQSPKRLRGDNMEDLIFSGSDTRKPLGMAEVTLTVENNGSNFPSPYDKFSEIAVTRRLYRSGESEFFINNTACRLRDIRELFMDTGMNPKAYAVIDQGHIGDIISSRPEDRRILIEEAAGIARYKERKAAALRKLEATEHNLLRLDDVIREVKRQIRSLKLQANKAEKYNRLRGEIEELELKMHYRQYVARLQEDRLQEEKLLNLEEIRESLYQDTSAGEAELETGRIALLDLDKKVAAAREEYYAHKAQSESVVHQLQTGRSRIEEIAAALSRDSAEDGRLASLLEENDRERAGLEEELQALATRLDERQAALTEAEEALSAIRTDSEAQRSRLDESSSRLFEEMKAESETKNRVTQAETLRDSLDREVRGRRSEIEANGAERERLDAQREEQRSRLAESKRKREELRQERADAAALLSSSRSGLEDAEQELLLSRERHAQASSRLASLTALEENLSGWPERFKNELERVLRDQRLAGQVKGLLASFIQVAPHYEKALEAVLGEKLKYLIVGSRETALEAAQALRSNGEIRGTLLPLKPHNSRTGGSCQGRGVLGPLSGFITASGECRSVIDHLLRDVVLVEDLSSAMAIWSANGGARTFVTAAGEVLWRDGSLTAGPFDPSREFLPLLRRIRETKEARLASGKEVEKFVQAKEALRREIEEGERREEELDERCYRSDIEISSLEKDISHIDQKIAALQERHRELQEACDGVITEQETLASTIAAELSLMAELEGGRLRRQQELNVLEEEISTLARREADESRRADGMRVELAAGHERFSHLKTRTERLASEKHQAEERQQGLAAELSRLTAEREREAGRLVEMERRARLLSESQEDRERRLAGIQEEHRKAAGRIHEIEENLRRIRLKEGDLREESAAVQAKRAELRVRIENLRERIDEIRSCAPEELWDEGTRAAVMEEAGAAIEEHHRESTERLQKLGPVNLAAIGDHQELQERLEFQARQKADLEKAAQDLRQAIQKINSTSRRKFLETFEQVNEQFQKVFPILFEKGHATLRLTESDDPLDAGIEVLAQPAGKKLQKLSLLSGGEKALAAIALLLAIFMVKPTPFCLLDEVDAPLDETNTARFLELLDDSINGSQLVVITHNKLTMERAANLLGVTMSDPGVSSLISVRLQEN